MKKLLLIILIISFYIPSAFAEEATKEEELRELDLDIRCGKVGAPPVPSREVENNAFGVGENFSYSINYGMVNAGRGRLSIPEMVEVAGRECYRLYSEAESNKVFSLFFKVEDSNECILDKEGLFTWYTERKLHEGDYRAHRKVVYDHCIHTATRNQKITKKIPPFILDVMGAFYYFRTLTFDVGDTVSIDIYEGKEVRTLQVFIHRKEEVEVPAGTFDCFVIEPQLKGEEGIFKHEGTLYIWITDDQYKVPVKVESKVIIVGRININLEEMTLSPEVTKDAEEEAENFEDLENIELKKIESQILEE